MKNLCLRRGCCPKTRYSSIAHCYFKSDAKKIETETQILRLISKSPLQVDIDFMKVSNHVSKNTSADHLLKFYDDFPC